MSHLLTRTVGVPSANGIDAIRRPLDAPVRDRHLLQAGLAAL